VTDALVGRYVELGLRLGRHVDGLVDAYYGPEALARRVEAEPLTPPARLAADARELLAGIDGGEPLQGPEQVVLDATPHGARRRWLRAQALGLLTTAVVLTGRQLGYADEVEACYGIRPHRVPEDAFAETHARLEALVPGSGPLRERFVAWREAQAVPPSRLEAAIASLAEDLRERTRAMFGLPEGEKVDFELVTRRPWSGFNYYLGGLRSRVAVNVDLPVLSTSLAHLVAHEAYPGHHTEHCRKEVGLVRRGGQAEEAIFLVGTPQCLMAEGLADLGLEVVVGRRPEEMVAAHLRPLGIAYEPEVVAAVSEAKETLGGARANAAFRLHEDGADPEVVVGELSRWALLPRERAAKAVEFLSDPTWRAYVTCYVEGLPLCRRWVGGKPERFARLITEQMVPADLA
jgi:hypothetical protein